MRLFDTLIGVLAPHSCLGCHRDGSLLCTVCRTLLVSPAQCCSLCKIAVSIGIICEYCIRNNGTFGVYAAVSYAGNGRQLVQALKFKRAKAAVDVIADIMTQRIPMTGFTLVPIPTATSRARARGYDQACLIARCCAKNAHVPVVPLLARYGQQRQVGSNKEQRSQQLHDAFRVLPLKLGPDTPLLLIDDVFTTGATIGAAASALRNAGYTNVQAAVFAVA